MPNLLRTTLGTLCRLALLAKLVADPDGSRPFDEFVFSIGGASFFSSSFFSSSFLAGDASLTARTNSTTAWMSSSAY